MGCGHGAPQYGTGVVAPGGAGPQPRARVGLQSGCQRREIFRQPRKVPAAAPFPPWKGFPHQWGRKGCWSMKVAEKPRWVWLPSRLRRRAPSDRPPPGWPNEPLERPFPWARGGGPPPGPAFGTSSVSLRFRGPGPVAAHRTSAATTAPDRQRTHRSPRAGGLAHPGSAKATRQLSEDLEGGTVTAAGTGAVGCSGRDGGISSRAVTAAPRTWSRQLEDWWTGGLAGDVGVTSGDLSRGGR